MATKEQLQELALRMVDEGQSDEKIIESLMITDMLSEGTPYFTNEKIFGRLAKKPSSAALRFLKELRKESPSEGFFLKIPKFDKDGIEIPGKFQLLPDFEGFSKHLKSLKHLKTNDAFAYLYEDNHFKQISPMYLKNLATAMVKPNTSPAVISQFVEAAKNFSFLPQSEFKQPDNLINLNNGILDVKENVLLPHSHDFFFKYKLAHDYVPGADCSNWMKFLSFVFKGNQELIDLSAEIFGYVLLGGEPFLHKAILLYGEGRNGKSTYLEVLKHLIGKINYSSVPIQNLSKPFSAVMLDGKLANVIGETTSDEVDSAAFKIAVSGEEITAAQKGMPEYPLQVTARIIFACNRLPYFRDPTSGGYEKLCILPFEAYIPPNERQPSYAKNTLFPEMSGILNWAIDGLKRLLERKTLPEVKAVDDELAQYRQEIDSVVGWVNEFIQISPDHNTPFQIRLCYHSYTEYCDRNARAPMSMIGFSRRVVAQLKKHLHIELVRQSSGWGVKTGAATTCVQKEYEGKSATYKRSFAGNASSHFTEEQDD